MPLDKAQLLDAVAKAGTQGATDYKAAQDRLAAQQADAVRLALSSGVMGGTTPGAQASVANIISQPYQARTAQISDNRATMQDYYGRLGASAGVYADQSNGLIPAIERQYQLSQSSGGGSGGGGGSDKSDFKSLLSDLGGTSNAKAYFEGQAKLEGDPYQARALAIEAGVPEALAASWYKYGSAQDEFIDRGKQGIDFALGKGWNVKQFKQQAHILAKSLPGNQGHLRKQLVKQYRHVVKQHGK